ncbi:MAG: KipI antagonist, partial [Pyrinomonadaceae bacterium]
IVKHQKIATALRILRGTHFDQLSDESKKVFLHETFRVSSASDRMGYRLEGERLKLNKAAELLSEPVQSGTIQLPSSGHPIILLADHQTHGGYPRIAHVVSVDIETVAQLQPDAGISFSEVTIEEAHELYLKREYVIEEIKSAIALRCGF